MDTSFLNEDFSTVSNLKRPEIEKLLEKNKKQKEELEYALIRNYWYTYAGKNVIVKNNQNQECCIILRGNRLFFYAEHTPNCPVEVDFNHVIENFDHYASLLKSYVEFRVVDDKEATEFIRELYLKKAEKSKALLKEILAYED